MALLVHPVCMSHPREIALVAFDGMQLLDLVGPAEVLDAANRALGRRHYRLSVATRDGKAARGGAGMRIAADAALDHVRARGLDTLIVSGGMNVDEFTRDERLVQNVRRLGRGA